MPVTPANSLSTQLQLLEDLLAASTAFQQWVQARDADDARGFIYWGVAEEDDDEAIVAPPYAIIDVDSDWGFERIATGQRHQLRNSGPLLLCLMDRDPYSEDGGPQSLRDGMVRFYNVVGSIADYIAENAGAAPAAEPLSIVGLTLIEPPYRPSIREEGSDPPRMEATFLIRLAD